MVRNEIVHVLGSHGAGIGEEVDLDGSGALGKDAGAAVCGEAVEVHCNVHFEFAAEFGNLSIRHGANNQKAVHRCGDALGHLVHGIRTEGESKNFKFAAVVPLE
jgi:hypothetical protein